MAVASLQYVNPAGLIVSRAFTQMVIVSGPVKTIRIGAQNSVDGEGNVVGKGDIAAQAEQILKNIDICLTAAGARREHLISWGIYIAEGQDLMKAAEVGIRWWGDRPNPRLNNVMFVSGFGNDYLLSIEAIAVVPDA